MYIDRRRTSGFIYGQRASHIRNMVLCAGMHQVVSVGPIYIGKKQNPQTVCCLFIIPFTLPEKPSR